MCPLWEVGITNCFTSEHQLKDRHPAMRKPVNSQGSPPAEHGRRTSGAAVPPSVLTFGPIPKGSRQLRVPSDDLMSPGTLLRARASPTIEQSPVTEFKSLTDTFHTHDDSYHEIKIPAFPKSPGSARVGGSYVFKTPLCRSLLSLCIFFVTVNIMLVVVYNSKAYSMRYRLPSHSVLTEEVEISPASLDNRVRRRSPSVSESNSDRRHGRGVKQFKPDSSPEKRSCPTTSSRAFRKVCDPKVCLRRLANSGLYVSNVPRNQPYSGKTRREIDKIPGDVDSVNMDMVAFLTDMQWRNNVTGSLGQLGVGLGQLAAVLVLNCHFPSGEEVLLSDHFDHDVPKEREILNHKRALYSVMRSIGFDVEVKRKSASESIHIHDGPSSEVNADLIHQLDMPRFRFFSVSHHLSSNNLLGALESVSCLLGDGAILSVDGVSQPEVLSAVKRYLTKYGKSGMTPFLEVGNSVYMASQGWVQMYADLLLLNRHVFTKHDILKATDAKYGPKTDCYVMTAIANEQPV